MTNKPRDTRAMFDCLDDYADEYGDQELIAVMKLWLARKMGKGYSIKKDYETNCDICKEKLTLLTKLSHEMNELSSKKASEGWQYQSALTDAMILIIKEMTRV